jgi:hypothetical protein
LVLWSIQLSAMTSFGLRLVVSGAAASTIFVVSNGELFTL